MSSAPPPTVADAAARGVPAVPVAPGDGTALAAVLVEQGRPLEMQRVALPVPGPGEVLVRVTACSLCGSDLHTAHGRRPHVVPTILGHEIVGVVAALGPGEPARDASGAPLASGARITWGVCASCGTCDRCTRGLPQKCRTLVKYGHAALDGPRGLAGGLADHVLLLRGTAIVRLPDGLADVAAAPASCAVATAAAILRTAGDVRDRSVMVLGAGMVGLAVASLARARGARVAILDPQAARRDRAAATLPGVLAIEPPAAGATASLAAALGGDDGADVVVEAGGAAASVMLALDLVATGGTVVLAGTVSPVGTVPLDPERVVRRQASICGVHNYRAEDLVTAVAHLAAADGAALTRLVGPVFPLERANDALAAAEAGQSLRVVVVP